MRINEALNRRTQDISCYAINKASSVIQSYRKQMDLLGMNDFEILEGRESTSLSVLTDLNSQNKPLIKALFTGIKTYWKICEFQKKDLPNIYQSLGLITTAIIAVGGAIQTVLICTNNDTAINLADRIAHTKLGGVDWDWRTMRSPSPQEVPPAGPKNW